MPAWTNDPSTAVLSLTPGVPAYSAGSLRKNNPARMLITGDSVSANVVTLNVAIVEGDIPSIGDLIYVYKTSNSAGALNTTVGIAISAVVITAATGIGTISYPLTTGNQGQTADTGYAQTTPGETSELLVANQGYRAFAIPKLVPELGANRSITLTVSFPVAPGAAKFSLQTAPRNVDAEFVSIITNETAAGTFSDSGAPGSASTQLWPGSWNFVRFKDTGSTLGGTPTVIAKITI